MEITDLRLSDLGTGEEAVINKVVGHGAFRKRITEMGFIKGKKVTVIKNAPLQDPVEYEIMGYNLSLRRSEASLVEVVRECDYKASNEHAFEGTIVDDQHEEPFRQRSKTINVTLVGNPNCGKTTLFNYLSGSHEHVGNYGGVTIDAKEAVINEGDCTLKITDLPGTYSITEYTPEELYVRHHILNNMPDVVVNVIDASNIERNLFLTTQLIDMNIRVIIALNMYDELNFKGIILDHERLGKLIGIPVVPTVAVKGMGISDLIRKVIEVYEGKDPVIRHIHINYGKSIEDAIRKIQEEIRKNSDISVYFSTRYLAIKLLENDKTTLDRLKECPNFDKIVSTAKKETGKLEKEYHAKSETIITDAKYGFISGALSETCTGCSGVPGKKKRDLDFIFTHKIWGFPVFLLFILLMFQATFVIGNYPKEWIDSGISLLRDFMKEAMPEGALRDLLVDGIIGGVGGVLIFLPNIIILFFFISLMEDTGYMARVSFIMDKLMHNIGLHGKSFIPLLMGFGCNVPAIMATRTLENRKDRITTMLIIPFMSCSARLPVYILIISAFFPKDQGLVLFSIYLTGIALAVLVALLLKHTLFAKQDVPFVMELPPYRMPGARSILKHLWYKSSQYLRKMGTVILFASILIWVLSYLPRNNNREMVYDNMIAAVIADTSLSSDTKASQIDKLKIEEASEYQEESYIGELGHFIEPVIRPLGFDWKIGISIISGLAAKEIVVSTMGVLYHAGLSTDEHSNILVEKLQQQTHNNGSLKGKKVFTPPVALGFMLFVLIYFPCVAVITAIKKEAGWRWALLTMSYTTLTAWIVAFITYHVGNLFF
ncbi:MAG: ferrous iron transport protein B [Bacteroidales bacterium]|nr:ferrous iron transport protein B [Bacteroidales bacterium]